MSDQATSLPVRTQTNGDVVGRLVDGTTTTQFLGIDSSGRITIKLQDGAGTAVTSQTTGTQRALDVGINVAGVQIDPRSIRALTSADVVSVVQSTSPWVTKDQSDGPVTPGTVASFSQLTGGQFNTALPTLTTGQQAALQVDSSGRLIVNVGSSGTLNTQDAADGPVTPGTVATKSILGGLQYNTSAPTFTTGQQGALQGDVNGNLLVSVKTSLPAGSALIGGTNVYVGGTIASASNPVPVTVTNSAIGTPVNDYNTAASIAAGATSNHTYTITTSKTFSGRKFWATSSGKMKAEIQTSPDGATYTTKWVGFNSTGTPNISIDLDNLRIDDVGTGATIRIIRTNLEPVFSVDLYSTISGTEN